VKALSAHGARHTRAAFQETRWSLVLRACGGSKEALEDLARAYWPAVYAFLRIKEFQSADAEDIAQETFTRLFKSGDLIPLDPNKGRFRSFLRACAEHEASHFRDRASCQKRGGDRAVSMDVVAAEGEFLRLPSHESEPDHVFDRTWSRIVVSRALTRLRSEYQRLGKLRVYEVHLGQLQDGRDRGDHRVSAAKLGLNEAAARTSWMRFKNSFIQHLRGEVAQTVHEPSEVESELRYLLGAWAASGN
jgi:RNA polymerase sigma factor (sigma-70 family)